MFKVQTGVRQGLSVFTFVGDGKMCKYKLKTLNLLTVEDLEKI